MLSKDEERSTYGLGQYGTISGKIQTACWNENKTPSCCWDSRSYCVENLGVENLRD